MTWKEVVDRRIVGKILSYINRTGSPYCPQYSDVFKAFSLVSPDEVKVVLVGQD